MALIVPRLVPISHCFFSDLLLHHTCRPLSIAWRWPSTHHSAHCFPLVAAGRRIGTILFLQSFDSFESPVSLHGLHAALEFVQVDPTTWRSSSGHSPSASISLTRCTPLSPCIPCDIVDPSIKLSGDKDSEKYQMFEPSVIRPVTNFDTAQLSMAVLQVVRS